MSNYDKMLQSWKNDENLPKNGVFGRKQQQNKKRQEWYYAAQMQKDNWKVSTKEL